MKIKKTACALMTAGVLCAALSVFCFAKSASMSKEASGLLEEVTSGSAALCAPVTKAAETGDELSMIPEYKSLHDQNSDFIGWLHIEDTKIYYPVMHTPTDPEYYLRRDWDGEYSLSGLPFLDYRCSVNEAKNGLMIYGHNMHDDTFFSQLLLYEDEEFFKEHSEIGFDTLYERGTYKIFAAFKSKVYGPEDDVFKYYVHPDFEDEAEFLEYVKGVTELSLYETDYEPRYGDELLTLSTCSPHTGHGRFAVVAVRTD